MEMKISYRREIKHNYMVVTPDAGAGPEYEANMLSANKIRGLMPMHTRYQNGGIYYYYDITSRQPLNRLLETRFITREEICRLMMQIHVALMGLEGYLLSDSGLLLDPELIYVDPELFWAELCLVPGQRGDFPEQLGRLLQYILKCVNHKDRECVVLAYGMYQESLKDNYGIEDILKFISPGNGMGGEEMKGRTEENGQEEHGGGSELAQQSAWEVELGRERKRRCEPSKPSTISRFPIKKQISLWLAAVVLLPAALWLFQGGNALRSYGWVLALADGCLLLAMTAASLAFPLLEGRNKAGKVCGEDKTEDSPWRILYEDEEEADPFSGEEGKIMEDDSVYKDSAVNQETFETTLLNPQKRDEELRRLKPIGNTGEEIVISYYPFVIGKNKNLTDYTLQRDTVSRFHLRLEEDGGQYSVTDLNSTNGTRIKGRLLDANETAILEIGDEIYIADTGYTFS